MGRDTYSFEDLLIGLVLLVDVEVEEGIFSSFVSLAGGNESEIFAVEVDCK